MNENVNKLGMWIDMPPEFFAKTRCKTLHVSARYFYEALADLVEEDEQYQYAAMIRDVASSYDADDDDIAFGDANGDAIHSYADWNILSQEERTNRGNRNAIIRILDRVRKHVQLMGDSADNTRCISEIRNGLTQLFF